MKVFVNAVSIREGGPRVALLKLVGHMVKEDSDLRICVAAPSEVSEDLDPAITAYCTQIQDSPFAVPGWYEFGLGKAAREWAADVVFSMTNYLPLRPLAIPTLLLEQHAGHFSEGFDRLMRRPALPLRERLSWRFKRWWVHRSVEIATVVTVQTAALADAMAAATRVPRDRIRVIPHGPGWMEHRPEGAAICGVAGGPIRIGYIAKIGVQKDFETVLKAVKKLRDEGRAVRLILTLNAVEPMAASTLAEARELKIDDLIENHGEVGEDQLTAIYDSLDLFVFASWCESFGMPMVEAMARGLCIVVADTPENREIVGSAGIVFPARDSAGLAATLARLCEDAASRAEHAAASLSRARGFSWQRAARETLAALHAAAANG